MLTDILDFFKQASPVAMVFGSGALAFFLWMQDRKERRSKTQTESVDGKLAEIRSSLEATTVSVNTAIREIHDMLIEHCSFAEVTRVAANNSAATMCEMHREQIQLLTKIAGELVTLNANTGRIVSRENSKLMIESQWDSCRNETIRVVCNSIENNNFVNNEQQVVRRVQLAWRQTADNAKKYLERIEGLQYPYVELFDEHLPIAWEYLWQWALPLYYRDCNDLREALRDYQVQAARVFQDVLEGYFDQIEDIDSGKLYKHPESTGEGSGFRRTRSETGVHVIDEDFQAAQQMVEKLKSYQKTGTGSGAHAVMQDSREALKKRLSRKR